MFGFQNSCVVLDSRTTAAGYRLSDADERHFKMLNQVVADDGYVSVAFIVM